MEIPEGIRKEPSRFKQYRLLLEHIEEHGILVTDVCLETNRGLQVLLSEILAGVERDDKGQSHPASRRLRRPLEVELATVDGRPLAEQGNPTSHFPAGYKVGLEGYNTREIRDIQRRGKTAEIYATFPARFRVRADEAYSMLTQYGYRIRWPEHRRRHSAKPVTNWILYEVGGPFDAEIAAKNGKRVEAKR